MEIAFVGVFKISLMGLMTRCGQGGFLLEAPEETLIPQVFHILQAPEFLGSHAAPPPGAKPTAEHSLLQLLP